jgi:DNA-binding CsgD family transcriptional regulator
MSSLFIRAKEFRVAQSVLSKMSAEQDPNGHVWAANFIACSIRLGDFEAARLAARRLANSNLPGSGSVGYTWGAIALCSQGESANSDIQIAQRLAAKCEQIARRDGASRALQAQAAFANAVSKSVPVLDVSAYEAAIEWLDCAPGGFSTELLTYMLRWGGEAAAQLNRIEEATRWLSKANELEATRNSAAVLAKLIGPMMWQSVKGLLNDEQRKATSYAANGLTMNDIADKMGLSASKVKRLLAEAREHYHAADTRELVACVNGGQIPHYFGADH